MCLFVSDDKTKYDVFICYSSKDWDWVRELLTELEKRSYSCFIDRRDFLPGMPIAENIAQAIDGSKKTVVVLSPDFVSSKWCNYELEMAYLQESGQSYHQVVPIVYRKCTIPRILQGKSYLDWENRKRNVWDALEKALSLPAPKDYDQTKDIPGRISRIYPVKEALGCSNAHNLIDITQNFKKCYGAES